MIRRTATLALAATLAILALVVPGAAVRVGQAAVLAPVPGAPDRATAGDCHPNRSAREVVDLSESEVTNITVTFMLFSTTLLLGPVYMTLDGANLAGRPGLLSFVLTLLSLLMTLLGLLVSLSARREQRRPNHDRRAPR